MLTAPAFVNRPTVALDSNELDKTATTTNTAKEEEEAKKVYEILYLALVNALFTRENIISSPTVLNHKQIESQRWRWRERASARYILRLRIMHTEWSAQ